jgi:hypothetical protein
VIVALPAAIPVTSPEELTVAQFAALVDHVTAALVAFDGSTVAVSCCVPPTSSDAVVGLTLTPVTATFTGVSTGGHPANVRAMTTIMGNTIHALFNEILCRWVFSILLLPPSRWFITFFYIVAHIHYPVKDFHKANPWSHAPVAACRQC